MKKIYANKVENIAIADAKETVETYIAYDETAPISGSIHGREYYFNGKIVAKIAPVVKNGYCNLYLY